MYTNSLSVVLKGREFLIEAVPVRIAALNLSDDVLYAPRVFEGTTLVNAHDMPRFIDPEEAVQHGFEFIKRLVKSG